VKREWGEPSIGCRSTGTKRFSQTQFYMAIEALYSEKESRRVPTVLLNTTVTDKGKQSAFA